MPPDDTHQPARDQNLDKRGDLHAAFGGVVAMERAKAAGAAKPAPAPSLRAWAVPAAILLWAGLAYLWLAQPAWLFRGPEGPARSSVAAEREARFGLYLERERVLEYLGHHGSLPPTLAAAGPVEEDVTYEVTGPSSFVLSTQVNGTEITLNGTEPVEPFLPTARPGITPH